MSEKVKAAVLVLDFELYPRQKIDAVNVGEIAEAMEAGEVLPPIVADKKSKRVIDGFHRIRAALKVEGEDAEIEVEFRNYNSEAEMFKDAVLFNASHGRKLTSYDKTHCIFKAQRLGIENTEIQKILHFKPAKIEKFKIEKVGIYKKTNVPLKRTVQNLAGKKLTKAQVETNEKAGGMPVLFYVNQIIRVIESGSIDAENENLIEGLSQLLEVLERYMAAKAA